MSLRDGKGALVGVVTGRSAGAEGLSAGTLRVLLGDGLAGGAELAAGRAKETLKRYSNGDPVTPGRDFI